MLPFWFCVTLLASGVTLRCPSPGWMCSGWRTQSQSPVLGAGIGAGGAALAGGGFCDHASGKIQHCFRYAFVHKQAPRASLASWGQAPGWQSRSTHAPWCPGPMGQCWPLRVSSNPLSSPGPSRLGVLIRAVTQNVFTDRTVFLAPVR